jgi:putative transposase
VQELRQEYPLKGLLAVSGLARSSFYYQLKLLRLTDKYASLKARICTIFAQHRGRYGYRRITAAIRREGVLVNRKTVQRLMGVLGLKSCVRIKKYRSYHGEVGRAAPNILEREFRAARPNALCAPMRPRPDAYAAIRTIARITTRREVIGTA